MGCWICCGIHLDQILRGYYLVEYNELKGICSKHFQGKIANAYPNLMCRIKGDQIDHPGDVSCHVGWGIC